MKLNKFLSKIPAAQNLEIPSIASLPEGIKRPFWSVAITTYNRTDYLEKAINSVLAQDLGAEEMQIEVVDDCSTNKDVEAIVREIGKGRVSFYSQPKNVGIYANWNTCIDRARGRWIHILSDDDLVMPDFYQIYRRYIETYQCSVAIAQSVLIDEYDRWQDVSVPLQKSDGLLDNALFALAQGNPIRTPGIVVAREAYEKVGGFTTSLVYAPDWEMWTRLASSTSVAYINRPYSCFRLHSSSQTNRLVLSATSVTDSLAAAKIIQSRLDDPKQREEMQCYVNRWLSKASVSVSRQMVNLGYYKAAIKHALWAFRLNPSLLEFMLLGWILSQIAVNILVGKPKKFSKISAA
jgi:glycosyltransferase involved in cell wall biosynthesis